MPITQATPLHGEMCPVQFYTSTPVRQRQGESLANQGNSKVRERVKKESQFPGALNFHHIVIVRQGRSCTMMGMIGFLKEREDESLCRKSSTFSNG